MEPLFSSLLYSLDKASLKQSSNLEYWNKRKLADALTSRNISEGGKWNNEQPCFLKWQVLGWIIQEMLGGGVLHQGLSYNLTIARGR